MDVVPAGLSHTIPQPPGCLLRLFINTVPGWTRTAGWQPVPPPPQSRVPKGLGGGEKGSLAAIGLPGLKHPPLALAEQTCGVWSKPNAGGGEGGGSNKQWSDPVNVC